jgi:hypothetical protein
MEKSMQERGILLMEKLLVQELPENERVLNDSLPEYWIIDGNHHVTTACEVFGKDDIDWVCDVVKVLLPYPSSLFNAAQCTQPYTNLHMFFQPNCPADDLMQLACFQNNMHNEAAVHCNDWETFFHIQHYLMQRHFWTMQANGSHQLNWNLFMNFLVP